jgi:hypothetical protein
LNFRDLRINSLRITLRSEMRIFSILEGEEGKVSEDGLFRKNRYLSK